MKTYQDLLAIGDNEAERMRFVLGAIEDHKASEAYKIARDAEEYAKQKNVTINQYRKLLYRLNGEAVTDQFSANHKCASNFFGRFTTQQASYLLGNGATFDGEGTADKLGTDFDTALYKAGKRALVEGCSFGYFAGDRVQVFGLTDFVPLWDEESGALRAGVRFWSLDSEHPLRATLYEEDGYTELIRKKGEEVSWFGGVGKRPYRYTVARSAADGERIVAWQNYPAFPIVPFWGNLKHESELVGMRENIDCYDLIKSGFANDLDDASLIYWTLENAGGMDDIDLARFVERMKTVKAAVVDGDGGAKATAHTMDVPHQGRETYLTRLENDLYNDYMALNVSQIAGGAVTATQIMAAYEPLNSKTDEFEYCAIDFVLGLLRVVGVEDYPRFNRSMIVNQTETTNMILASAAYLDDETILKKLPFLTREEREEIMRNRIAEDAARFAAIKAGGEDDGEDDETLTE